jgi:hypothetical protein
MGIESWAPLVEDDKNYLAVKCICKSRADLSVILLAYYITGKKFKLTSGLIVTVTFSPNVTNPLQCYNCFKFDQHIAENCERANKICERCGENDHEYEHCPNNPKCVNCTSNDDHESRDRQCPVFKELKNEKICKAIYGITGEALRRYDDSKNDRYLQAKQREKDGTMVYSKMNEIEKNVKTKIAYIQRQSEDTKVALEDQFNKLKNQANNSVAEIKKAADYAKAACDHINTNMKVAVEKEMNNFTVKIRKEFQTNIQNLEKGVDVIESNLNIVHEKLTSWRTVSEMKQVALENRITAIENHIMTIQSGTNLNFAPYKPNQQEIQMLQQQQQINQPQQIRFGQQHNHTQQQQQLIQTNLNPQNVLQQASPYINNINPIANNANSFHIGSQSLQHVT